MYQMRAYMVAYQETFGDKSGCRYARIPNSGVWFLPMIIYSLKLKYFKKTSLGHPYMNREINRNISRKEVIHMSSQDN